MEATTPATPEFVGGYVSLDFGRLLMKHSNNRCAFSETVSSEQLILLDALPTTRLPLDLWKLRGSAWSGWIRFFIQRTSCRWRPPGM